MKENYQKKFNFLSKYDASKGGQLLQEQLVPAKLDDLKHAMEQDNELRIFLNTPAKDLPDHYKFLVQEITPDIENKTLLSLIQTSIDYNPYGGEVIPLFSVVNNRFVGFAGYTVSGNEVLNIKIGIGA